MLFCRFLLIFAPSLILSPLYAMAKLNPKELVRCTKQAFAEELEMHWVLFAHGAIVKLPRTAGEDLWGTAVDRLRKHQLSFIDDFPTQKLPGVEGWLVEIKEQAFYVYLHPSDIQWDESQGSIDFAQIAKEKFMTDARSSQPVYVHLQPAIQESPNRFNLNSEE